MVTISPRTNSCFDPSSGSGNWKNSSAVNSFAGAVAMLAPPLVHERELVRQQQHLGVLLPRRQLRVRRRPGLAHEATTQFYLLRLRPPAVEQAVQHLDAP